MKYNILIQYGCDSIWHIYPEEHIRLKSAAEEARSFWSCKNLIVLTTKGKLPNTSHFRFWPVATTKASALQHFPSCHGTIWPQACFDYLRLGCISCTRGTKGGLFFYRLFLELHIFKLLPNEMVLSSHLSFKPRALERPSPGICPLPNSPPAEMMPIWWSADRTLRANVLWRLLSTWYSKTHQYIAFAFHYTEQFLRDVNLKAGDGPSWKQRIPVLVTMLEMGSD